jgi:membrane associated rhomboid family serine protease
MKLRVRYNAPVVLTFSLACVGVLLLFALTRGDAVPYFTAPAVARWANPVFYLRLFTHVLGHGDWHHLLANLTVILLLGPLLEEKYGSVTLLEMIAITAGVTGALNVLLFDTGLMGASGVAFMLIVLASLANFRRGEVPLTFVLVAVLFLGAEVAQAMGDEDNVSQFAHVVGGLCGAGLGWFVKEG